MIEYSYFQNAEVFLVSLIINLIWGERQDFEINKPEKG